ncbi:hypothetical protein BJ138DRAFT_1121743 [Hygrophoropsis aurantiaca]|uniref:Uncharacterized protein n=1 Tax=Hygrophoropsis aurantiaca TaxID=72124 RepID=A0ACB8AT35_9AGAM|nr:hypothetical protein BJ138DRAFT_1121743 [Hygrophoropsis aurantiaca]
MTKAQASRKQQRKKKSSAHKDLFARLVKNAASADPDFLPSASSSASSSSSNPTSNNQSLKDAPALDYSNILLIEEFQAAVDNRAAVCRRLEFLVRSSPIYSRATQSRLLKCLRNDFERGEQTREVIDTLRQSVFISASGPKEDNELARQEILESTRLFFEGSKELYEIGDKISVQIP